MTLTSIVMEIEPALAAVSDREKISYNDNWIADSDCSNHMTGDKEKLTGIKDYRGG